VAIVLSEGISRRIREEAEKRGATPEEYILGLLTKDLDCFVSKDF